MYNETSLIVDIQEGLTDSELMQKHEMVAEDLREKLFQLSREGIISYSDIYWRPLLYEYDVEKDERRSIPRYSLRLLLPVEEKGSADASPGLLIDINERGGCLQGLEVEPGRTVTLEIYPEGLVPADKISLEALIQWVNGGGDAPVVAGFVIADISEQDTVLLRDLIRTMLRSE